MMRWTTISKIELPTSRKGGANPIDPAGSRAADIIRFQCTTLPAGGTHAELYRCDGTSFTAPMRWKVLRAALDNMEQGIILLDRNPRRGIHGMRRCARQMAAGPIAKQQVSWHLPTPRGTCAAKAKPSTMPGEELEIYIAQRNRPRTCRLIPRPMGHASPRRTDHPLTMQHPAQRGGEMLSYIDVPILSVVPTKCVGFSAGLIAMVVSRQSEKRLSRSALRQSHLP